MIKLIKKIDIFFQIISWYFTSSDNDIDLYIANEWNTFSILGYTRLLEWNNLHNQTQWGVSYFYEKLCTVLRSTSETWETSRWNIETHREATILTFFLSLCCI